MTNDNAEITCPWCSHQASIQLNPQHVNEDIGVHCGKCSRYSTHKVAHPLFDARDKKLKDSREVWKRVPPDAYLTCRQGTQGTVWIYTLYLGKGMPEECQSRDIIEHRLIKEFGMTWEQANAIILSAVATPGYKVHFQGLTKISAELEERGRQTVIPQYRQGQAVRVSGVDGIFLRYAAQPGMAVVAFAGIGDSEVPVIEFEVLDTGDSPREVGFDVEPISGPEGHAIEEEMEAMDAGNVVEQIEDSATAVQQMLDHEVAEGEDETEEEENLESALEHLEEAKDSLMDFSMEETDEAEEFESDGFEMDERDDFETKPEEEKEEKEEKREAKREMPSSKICAGCGSKHRGLGAWCGNCKEQRKAWWNKAPWEVEELTRDEEPVDSTDADETDAAAENKDNWIPRENDQYPEYAKELPKKANKEAQRRVHTHFNHSRDLKRAISVNADDLSVRDIREILAFYANTAKIDTTEAATLAEEFIGDRSTRLLNRTAGDVVDMEQARQRLRPGQNPPTSYVTVYTFPNGFGREAESMYGWLRNPQAYGVSFNPKWGPFEGGAYTIQLPQNEVTQLRRLQETDPARWGNPPKNASRTAEIHSDECVNCGKHGEVDERGRCEKCARKNHVAVITGGPGSYHVKSEEGKNLGGPYKSREQAKHRLKQVEYFKHKKSRNVNAVDADDDGYGADADGQSCQQCGQRIPEGSSECPSCMSNPMNVNATNKHALLNFGLGIFQPARYKGKDVLVIAVDNTGTRVTVQDSKKRMFTVDAADLQPALTGPYTKKPR